MISNRIFAALVASAFALGVVACDDKKEEKKDEKSSADKKEEKKDEKKDEKEEGGW